MKKLFALFALCVLFFSCEVEYDVDMINEPLDGNTTTNLKSYIYIKEKLEGNGKLQKKIKAIKSSPKNKNVVGEDFTVVTDFATFIISPDSLFHSYTFPILREEDNGMLENLVLTLNEEGGYNALLLSYMLSNEQYNDLVSNIPFDVTDILTITPLENETIIGEVLEARNPTYCGFESQLVCSEQACGIDGCWDSEFTSWSCQTLNLWICSDTEVDDSGIYQDGPAPQPDYGSLGGVTTGGHPPDTVTIPQDVDIMKFNLFRQGLSAQALERLNSDIAIQQDVFNFLKNRDFALSYRDTIEDALELMGDGDNILEIIKNLVNCRKANELLQDNHFTNALDDIESEAHDPSESGYEISREDGSNLLGTEYKQGGFYGVRLKTGGTIIGGIHHHTDDGYPMFSADDLRGLLIYFIKHD